MFDQNIIVGLSVYAGVVGVFFWLAMVIWTYRDMRARSRDILAHLFVVGVVAVLNIPGLVIYLLLRPRETLSESYERSLEEEALLQEIEEKPTCPGCGHRVHVDWQACPYCHTRLKQPCVHCHNLLELSWTLCPYCAADQTQPEPNYVAASPSQHVYQQQNPPVQIPDKWLASSPPSTPDYPQYVDDEY